MHGAEGLAGFTWCGLVLEGQRVEAKESCVPTLSLHRADFIPSSAHQVHLQ